MDRRALKVALVVWLATATAFVLWFDYAALSALLHPGSGSLGHFAFAVPGYSNTVLPFTYIAVGLSIAGVTWYIFQQERSDFGFWPAFVLGLVVANVASVGMINCYEQVYIGLGCYQPALNQNCVYWMGQYWGTAGGLASTLTGVLIVLTIAPWARRRNWKGIGLMLALTGIFFAGWYAAGYGSPPNGSVVDYWMNAGSRIASQLALVAAVSTRDWFNAISGWTKHLRGESNRSRPILEANP